MNKNTTTLIVVEPPFAFADVAVQQQTRKNLDTKFHHFFEGLSTAASGLFDDGAPGRPQRILLKYESFTSTILLPSASASAISFSFRKRRSSSSCIFFSFAFSSSCFLLLFFHLRVAFLRQFFCFFFCSRSNFLASSSLFFSRGLLFRRALEERVHVFFYFGEGFPISARVVSRPRWRRRMILCRFPFFFGRVSPPTPLSRACFGASRTAVFRRRF